MKNNFKPALLLFFIFSLISQNYDIYGQNNIPDLIRQRFKSYLESVQVEKIFIHTDRDEYISGEEVWFAIYLIDRQSGKPSGTSRIAYFELLNAESRPVLQKRIYLENGFGPGQITLPDTLSSGIYTIRSYTNQMRNFLPYNSFLRDIRIFNPFNNRRLYGSPGKNQITAFDLKGEPVCLRNNYTPSRVNPVISLQSGESYGVREKVIVDLLTADSLTNNLKPGSISISVSPLTEGSQRSDLKDYLIFRSESGFNKSALSSEKTNDIPPEIIDSMLFNINSRWIDWSLILSGRIPDIVYKPEREFHLLRGKMTSGDTAISSSGYVLLSIPGREPGFQYAKTDSAGNFSFNIEIDGDIKDLVLMPDDVSRMQKIILESGFAELNAPVQIASGTGENSIPQYISDWSINYQIRKIYGVSSSGSPVESPLRPLEPVRFYGKPDIELFMADYVTLPKMEEVFYELIPHVSMKKKNTDYEILITDRINDNWYELSPALFLDGVKINDASIFEALDPSIVERIEVIKEKYFVGDYSFPGLVNITTRSADFSTIPLPDYMIRLPYRVIDPVRSFISPDYSSSDLKNSPIPDFRNTLYWNPSVKTDSEGNARIEFWTSDFVTEYEINVQGITSDGEVISARKTFRVE